MKFFRRLVVDLLVFLTVFILLSGYAASGEDSLRWDVKIDTTSLETVLLNPEKILEDPDKIFNSLTHECFHIGYGFNRYLRKEMKLENSFLYNTVVCAGTSYRLTDPR